MELQVKIIEHNSPEYKEAVALREEILRKPLGLIFTSQELAQEKNHIHIVGLLNKKIVATAVLVPEKNKLKMQRVAVKSDLQSKGIGSALLQFCQNYASENNFKEIYCHARYSAVQFYLKNGYIKEGQMFDEDGILHLKMRQLIHCKK